MGERVRAFFGRIPFFGRLMKNVSWLYMANLVGRVSGFLLTILIAAKLSITDYGLIGLVISYANTVNRLLDFRIWETVINYYGKYLVRGERRRAWDVLKLCYAIDFGTGVIALVAVWLSAEIATGWFMDGADVANLVQIYSLSLLINTLDGTASATLRVYDQFKTIGTIRAIVSLSKVVLVVVALWIDASVVALTWAYVAHNTVNALLFNVASIRATRQRLFATPFDDEVGLARAEIRPILRFTVGTNILGTLQQVAAKSDVLMMGLFTNTAEVGVFRLAFNLVRVPVGLSQPLISVIYPDIVKVRERTPERLPQLLRSATLMGIGIVGSVALAMLLLIEPVLNYFVDNPDYIAAVTPMRIMMVGLLAQFTLFWLQSLMTAADRVGVLNMIQIVRIALWLGLAALLVPSYGALGGAIVFAFSRFFWIVTQAVYVWHQQLWTGATVPIATEGAQGV